MSALDDKNSRQSNSYITWLGACDKAFALGRSLLESPTSHEFTAADSAALDVLRRLDRLRAPGLDQRAVFVAIEEDVTISDDGILQARGHALQPASWSLDLAGSEFEY
jgi:hypothetical protein